MKKALAFFAVLFITAGCVANAPYLKLDKKVYKPGERIAVEFKALKDYADNAWIGIIPSNVPHGDESENDRYDLTYQYIRKMTSGTMIFRAPLKVGFYDIRMHDTDNRGKEVASVTFEVR